jgi:isoaspartyl peptidase/L-asparaginase-like protein (Ntn-hydrolase superfamily)
MAMKRTLILAAAALALAGCSTTSAVGPSIPPPAAVGAASIVGMGAYVTSAGRDVSCAGQSVALLADTVKMQSRMLALYGSSSRAILPVETVKAKSAGLEPSAPPVNSAACNDRGEFVFADVQPGLYYLIARVKRLPASSAADELVIMQRVSVQPGETRHVRLAP